MQKLGKNWANGIFKYEKSENNLYAQINLLTIIKTVERKLD